MKMQAKLSSLAVSSNSLPSFLVRTIIDQTHIKNVMEEHKKRISSARKIYSNMERYKIKTSASSAIVREAEQAKPLVKMIARRVRSADLLIEKKAGQVRVVRAKRDDEANSLASKREEAIRIDYINKMNDGHVNSSLNEFRIKKLSKNEARSKKVPTAARNDRTTTSMTKIKPRETNLERYIKNLKQLLKEKAGQFRLDLPLLCQCNMNSNLAVWDIDWNKCANNCLFYKNPKGRPYFYFI